MNDREQRGDGTVRRRQRGFTLIEITVALAILAVALGALFQAFSGSLRATGATERRGAAVMFARSLLDRVGQDLPLAAGEQSGTTEDGLRWRIVIAPSQLIPADRRDDSPVVPFDVEVTVTADGGGAVTLATLRLAPFLNLGGFQ